MTRLLLALLAACSTLAAEDAWTQVTSPLGRAFRSQPDNDALRKAVAAVGESAESKIALARAYDRLLQFDKSIPIYTALIAADRNDVRAYRYRGHRYISTRRFKEAIRDLKTAARIAPGSFDVVYQLGLAQYLNGQFANAATTYQECLNWTAGVNAGRMPKDWRACDNLDDDSRIAMGNWCYAALRRAGRSNDAAVLAARFNDKMAVKENVAYLNALLFYKGERDASVFESAKLTGSSLMALGYPIANFALIQGDRPKACGLFQKLMTDEANWAAFGFIAAETEIAHRKSCPTSKR